jgi:hypothetical protein
MKLGIALLKLWRFFIGNRSFITEINGDLWIASNATYDGTNWNRVDTTKYAFAIQIQGYGNIPGETFQGVNIWKAAPGENPIGNFFQAGGWETLAIGTAYSSLVIGGSTIEVDGSGAQYGYSRIICLNDGLHLTFNAYWDGTHWQADVLNHNNIDYWLNNVGPIVLRRAYTVNNPIIWYAGDGTKARAYKGTPDQSLPAATETKVQLNAKTYDYCSWFDANTNFCYTIGNAVANGQYLITAAVTFVATASNSKAYIFITKNGTRVAVAQANIIAGGGDVTITLSDIQELSYNDYVDLWAYSQLATTIKASNTGTYLALAKLL